MKQPALGLKITELRNSKGYTQKELADLCKVDIRTIQRIESGDVEPRMYTLNLLSEVLAHDLKEQQSQITAGEQISAKGLKSAFISGIVFSVNAIPVVVDLTQHSLHGFLKVLTYSIHSISPLLFYYGFYLLSKKYKNQRLAISTILAMVLLPMNNALYLLDAMGTGLAYILLCTNVILFGIGMISVGLKSAFNFKRLYLISGIMLIIEGCMFISFNTRVIDIGLYISLFFNNLLLVVLYLEYQNAKQRPVVTGEPVLA